MESKRRTFWVYGLLIAAWLLVLGWQAFEHFRVKENARAELRNRAKDISTTVGIVLRSQRIFGVISKERLESALNDLVHPGELNAVAMLNANGDIVASAPTNSALHARTPLRQPELWETGTVTLMNLVDLGTSVTSEFETTNPPIVLPRDAFPRGGDTNRTQSGARFSGQPDHEPPPLQFNPTNASGEIPPEMRGTNRGRGDGERRSRGEGDGRGRRPRFGRPPWMSEAEFQTMIQKQGVHSFIIVMSTRSVSETDARDLWLRTIIAGLATLSVVGFGMAWRNMIRTSDLQIRLVRASELNSHLKELNVAAAGLAHETRNPLNIIRGLAQMISRQSDAPAEVHQKSADIISETDRVTAQLNEFINYSRPREVRPSVVSLGTVVADVARALNYDLEEKHVQLHIEPGTIAIEADEQLLRQALFNLLLNAVQAVPDNGEVRVRAAKLDANEGMLEICDNGPGVAVGRREEIFRPYFTTNSNGTGLGLAVVQQIVLAHGWEIECVANEPTGALFRIRHLKLAG